MIIVVKQSKNETKFHASFKSSTQAKIYCNTANNFMKLLGEKVTYSISKVAP